jgi:LmbE family N-acetylglucosaminyl deacetylase
VKPHAIFTQGPYDVHRDHLATHLLTKSAFFHAGEPVTAEMGTPWKTPYLYYYVGVKEPLPRVLVDVSDFKEKSTEAWSTQKSQYTVFRKTAADFKREIEALKKSRAQAYDVFWIAEPVILTDLLPLGIDAPDNYYGARVL